MKMISHVQSSKTECSLARVRTDHQELFPLGKNWVNDSNSNTNVKLQYKQQTAIKISIPSKNLDKKTLFAADIDPYRPVYDTILHFILSKPGREKKGFGARTPVHLSIYMSIYPLYPIPLFSFFLFSFFLNTF